MHIAHYKDGDLITVQQVAKIIGLKRRAVAYLAKKRDIPDVTSTDGCHYAYRNTPRFRNWAERKRREVKAKKRPLIFRTQRNDVGVLTIQGIRMEFDIWLRKVGQLEGILKMEEEIQDEILRELEGFALLFKDILKSRDS